MKEFSDEFIDELAEKIAIKLVAIQARTAKEVSDTVSSGVRNAWAAKTQFDRAEKERIKSEFLAKKEELEKAYNTEKIRLETLEARKKEAQAKLAERQKLSGITASVVFNSNNQNPLFVLNRQFESELKKLESEYKGYI